MAAGPPAELAFYLHACAGIERTASASVGPGLVALWRGDTVVWAGPYERLAEAPKDCTRVMLNRDDRAAWFPAVEEAA